MKGRRGELSLQKTAWTAPCCFFHLLCLNDGNGNIKRGLSLTHPHKAKLAGPTYLGWATESPISMMDGLHLSVHC